MAKTKIDQGEAVASRTRHIEPKTMTKSINFTEEASKVSAVFTAFQDEITRLSIENRALHLKIATLLSNPGISAPATIIDNSWQCAPDEVAEPVAEEPIKNKRRGPNKPALAESRCQALLPCIEMNGEGELVPSQCKRGCENATFCKQHASHHNFGTAEHPNLEEFAKHHDQLMKAFNKKNGIEDTKKPKRSKSAVKRALNPYMMFLAVNRDMVKEQILLETPEMKGRALAMTITSRVGRLWQAVKGNAPDDQHHSDHSDNTDTLSELSSTAEELQELQAICFDE